MAEEAKLDEASKAKTGKTTEYKCKTKCYWNNTLYNVDDVVILTDEDAKNIPEHFEKVK